MLLWMLFCCHSLDGDMTASADGPWWAMFGEFWLVLALVGIPGILGGLTNSITFIIKPVGGEMGKHSSRNGLQEHGLAFYLAHGVTGLGG